MAPAPFTGPRSTSPGMVISGHATQGLPQILLETEGDEIYAIGGMGTGSPPKKRLLAMLETDGCFADGVEAATGCSVGHRTLRVEDYGKIAAVFVETKTGRAVRLAPRLDVRERARFYAPEEIRHYFAQLEGYQRMPADELFTVQEVTLTTPLAVLLSRPGVRVNCDGCGEEIINGREIVREGMTLCRGCAVPAYYQPVSESPIPVEQWLLAPSLDDAGD